MGQRAGCLIKFSGILNSDSDYNKSVQTLSDGNSVIGLYNQWAYGYKLVRTLGHFGRYIKSPNYYKHYNRPETILTIASFIQRPLEDGVHISNWVFEELIPLNYWDNNDGFLLIDLTKNTPEYAILDSSLKQLSLKDYLRNYKELTEYKKEIKILIEDMQGMVEMSTEDVKAMLESVVDKR